MTHLCSWGRPFHRLGWWRRLCVTCKGQLPTLEVDYFRNGGVDRREPCRICWPDHSPRPPENCDYLASGGSDD